jgi:hypothetical protein
MRSTGKASRKSNYSAAQLWRSMRATKFSQQVHHDRAVHPIFQGRSHPMGAVAAAVVDRPVIRAPSNRGGGPIQVRPMAHMSLKTIRKVHI